MCRWPGAEKGGHTPPTSTKAMELRATTVKKYQKKYNNNVRNVTSTWADQRKICHPITADRKLIIVEIPGRFKRRAATGPFTDHGRSAFHPQTVNCEKMESPVKPSSLSSLSICSDVSLHTGSINMLAAGSERPTERRYAQLLPRQPLVFETPRFIRNGLSRLSGF